METPKFYQKLEANAVLLQRFARHLTNDPSEARHLYREASFQASKKRTQLRGEENFKDWLKEILIDTFKKKFTQQTKLRTGKLSLPGGGKLVA
ncbi:MAG: sigma factor [Bacteroidota bacterium]